MKQLASSSLLKGEFMGFKATILVASMCLLGIAQAQTVTGSGTPGTVPVFTSRA
jgi:hypothetical protein